MADDLPYLVFGLDSRLEKFRATSTIVCIHIDHCPGVSGNRAAVDPVNASTTQYTCNIGHVRPRSAGTKNRCPITYERRQYEQPRQTAPQPAFATIRQHAPRRGNREMWLRYLSARGCAPGDPSQSNYSTVFTTSSALMVCAPISSTCDTRLSYRTGQAALASGLQVAEAVAAYATDSRPNKALNQFTYSFLLQVYPHCAFVMRIATDGFRMQRLQQLPNETQRPRNH
ncbi:LOW QUALITY PROTEIN: hypothetical protein PHPALM_30620 [Phytophthora palmivora]|uniref:Uncharacterized protein n=1 Tax=Phytophthora palmivora TaxID=4796 RepID=A0A2P4X4P3_9STRA|nr:LOW QUALITY PROTEIN: hypothetical protein PHPALM_30620 [Phytophthora palmivora]